MPRHATETFPPTSTLLSLPRQTSEGRSRSVCRNRARPVLSHLAAHGEQPQRWANRYSSSTRKLHCQPGLFGRTFSHSLASPWLVLHWIFVSELLGVVCRAFACVSQTNSCGFARRCCATRFVTRQWLTAQKKFVPQENLGFSGVLSKVSWRLWSVLLLVRVWLLPACEYLSGTRDKNW